MYHQSQTRYFYISKNVDIALHVCSRDNVSFSTSTVVCRSSWATQHRVSFCNSVYWNDHRFSCAFPLNETQCKLIAAAENNAYQFTLETTHLTTHYLTSKHNTGNMCCACELAAVFLAWVKDFQETLSYFISWSTFKSSVDGEPLIGTVGFLSCAHEHTNYHFIHFENIKCLHFFFQV